MNKVVIAILLIGGVALVAITSSLMTDATNLDVVSPMPSYPQDVGSDIFTVQDDTPIELSEGMQNVAVIDELTDYGRDVSSNQVQQAEDATGALATVSVASYAMIAGIIGGYNARDIILAIALCVALYIGLRMMTAKNKDGEK